MTAFFFTFLHDPPRGEQRVMQRQRGMLGVRGVSWSQPAHHRLHRDVGKTKRSGGKDICDAGIHLRIVTLVGRHETGRGDVTEDLRQVVLPS